MTGKTGILGGLILLLSACGGEGEAVQFCHYVQLAEARDFTGKRLKFAGEAERTGVQPLAECIQQDQQLEGGDGPEAGRMRWVVCWRGPDCDEAGMF